MVLATVLMNQGGTATTAYAAPPLIRPASVQGLGHTPSSAQSPSGEDASGEAGGEEAGGPLAVPYLGELKVSPGRGWVVGDCAAVVPPEGIEAVCDESGILLRAPNFDPAWGERVLSVPLVSGSLSTTIAYRVVLAPPTPPVLTGGIYGYPFESGSRILLPLSELGIECASCGSGSAISVTGVEPATAGTATVSPTHLVLRAATGYVGDAVVSLRVTDAAGQKSEPTAITLRLIAEPSHTVPADGDGPAAAPLGALHVYAPRDPAGASTVDLHELVWGGDADSVQFLGCGVAAAGEVSCGADGIAHYAPSAAASVDQFSFHVFSADGQQATGSVTLVDPAAAAVESAEPAVALPSAGLVPSSASTTSPLAIATRTATEQAKQSAPLAPLSRIFDRMQNPPAKENR